MSDGDIFTALGVVVAGLAALLAGYYSKKTIDNARRAEMLVQEANEHAFHSNLLNAHSWLDQYLTNVRIWAEEACDNISIAIHAVQVDGLRRDELLHTSLHKLSSLIDRGRWFFPNLWSDEYGQHKEPAYHGIRQPILDYLVDAYRVIETLLKAKDNDNVLDLVHSQRMFVSEVQQVLNPRRREQEIKRIDRQFDISEKLRDRNGNKG